VPRPAEVNQVLRFFCGAHDGSHLCENMGTGERKIRLVTTSGKNGNNSARKAGTERGREEGVSEDRFQAKQTNSLRARGPRGLEFRCGPANWRNKSQKQEPPCKARCVNIQMGAGGSQQFFVCSADACPRSLPTVLVLHAPNAIAGAIAFCEYIFL